MKKIALWLSLLSGLISPVAAQVGVEVTLEQDQFLPGEALQVAVRITSHAGQTLILGGADDWLTFSVESPDGIVVPKTSDLPAKNEFPLQSSKVATVRVNLAPYFALTQPGRYAVTATIKIKGWDSEVTSRPKGFYIIQGAKLWEQEIGIPKPTGASAGSPEVRKYILQQANYLKNQLRLYLRLTDASEAKVFRVIPIGQLVSFSRPEPQVDKLSNLHVLYQNGPHSFSYTVCNPDGDMLIRQTYDYVSARPRLRGNGEGSITVEGGVRRMMASDFPVPKPETPLEEPSKTAGPTNEFKQVKP